MGANPNFPANLDIKPLTRTAHTESEPDRKFDASAQEDAIREYGIAGRVWEAAYAMKAYLNLSSELLFDPPFVSHSPFKGFSCILELGSGTGVVAAQLADQMTSNDDLIVVTDLPEVCSLLEKNLLERHIGRDDSSCPTLLVRPLRWGDHKHALDIHEELRNAYTLPSDSTLTHIICSDLIYFPDLLAPLLRSLIHLTSPPFVPAGPGHAQSRSPTIIISYKVRSLAKETAFWSAFGLWFIFEPVLEKRRQSADSLNHSGAEHWHRFGASFGSDMFIFIAHRRPESMTWGVPGNDGQLLEGVGARGSSSQKGDGTFESLLLMSIDTDD